MLHIKNTILEMKQTKFRPHWLINNSKMYADTVKHDSGYYCIASHFKESMRNFNTFYPVQTLNKETDFSFKMKNGSIIEAKWIGEENECA